MLVPARSRQSLLSRVKLDSPGVRREAQPGHLAGRLAVRTQGQGWIPEGSSNGQRGPEGPGANPAIAKLANRLDEQLIQGPLEPCSRVLEPGTRPGRPPGLRRRRPS